MPRKLIYVELKTGYDDNGPAWIGYGLYNRTGQTLYFNGIAFRKAHGINGNYFSDRDEYWITGIKKNAEHRYPWGKGKIQIDKDAIAEYKELTGLKELLKSKYEIVNLNNTIPAEYHERHNGQM
ncbi:MAG: hypothetical protein K8F30_02365 [Taibaiella sp.]|nr:hypothetical protein [Taibaiella sp.]